MRLQGTVHPEVAGKLKEHFKLYDPREAAMQEEIQHLRRRNVAEGGTQLAAVKRLIQRVSSLSVGEPQIKALRSKTMRNVGLRRSLSQKDLDVDQRGLKSAGSTGSL